MSKDGLFDLGEDFQEKIYDFFPGIIYVYNTDTRKLTYVNKKITDVLGYSFDDIKTWDNDFTKVIFKDDIDLVQKELEKFNDLRDEQSYSYKCRFNRKDGDWMHFHVLGKVLRRDPKGKPASLLLVAQDMQEQIRSAEELRATRELAEDNEELLQFGNWNWNPKTDTLLWSRGMYTLMDFDPEAELRKITMDFYRGHIKEEDRDQVKAAFDHAQLNKDKTVEFTYSIVTHQQREKIFYSKGNIIYDTQGEVLNIVGTTRDITQLRKYELELERKISELDHSNRELEDFAYAASHDLQEPLRKISTLSDRLQTKFNDVLPEDGKKYLERIRLATRSSQALIDSLMEFSRITHVVLNFERVDLNALLEEVKSDLEMKIEETQAVIQVDKLPALESSTLQLKQLFSNILLNSIKFRKEDEAPFIEIKSRRLELQEMHSYHLDVNFPHFLITVKDNGIGFEETYASKIFHMFTRLHGKSEYPGAGIGLALCRKIVENHKGLIFAAGTPGEGAVISVILPEKRN